MINFYEISIKIKLSILLRLIDDFFQYIYSIIHKNILLM